MATKTYRKKQKIVDAMEWSSAKPYESFQKLVEWVGASGPFYLDGLERGIAPTGVLIMRDSYGCFACRNGDFILKHENGDLGIASKANFSANWEEYKAPPDAIL